MCDSCSRSGNWSIIVLSLFGVTLIIIILPLLHIHVTLPSEKQTALTIASVPQYSDCGLHL
jgi:hypothetical protein